MNNHLVAWSPPTPALVVAGVGGVVLGTCAAALPLDPPGRLLVGLAAFGLLVITVLGFRLRPRLAVLPGPRLQVAGVLGPKVYEPHEVTKVRVVRFPRLGRKTPMLEIDVRQADEERLHVLSRWDLGRNPDDVFDALSVHGLVRPQ